MSARKRWPFAIMPGVGPFRGKRVVMFAFLHVGTVSRCGQWVYWRNDSHSLPDGLLSSVESIVRQWPCNTFLRFALNGRGKVVK